MFIDIHSQEYLLNRNKTKEKKKQEQREGKMDTTIRQSRKKKQFFFLLFFFVLYITQLRIIYLFPCGGGWFYIDDFFNSKFRRIAHSNSKWREGP